MRHEIPPLLARVAGLPATAVEILASSRCAAGVEEILALEQELGEIRRQLVDRLYAAASEVPAEVRRLLISVKRDSFNGRSLARHRRSPGWSELVTTTDSFAERAVEVEVRLGDAQKRLQESLETERDRQVRSLLALLLASPGLLRGLALASPPMVEEFRRSAQELAVPVTRGQRKLAVNLFRYVSRAALKLSPNSTLTRLAVGRVDNAHTGGLELHGSDWRECSLVRLRRVHVDRWCDLLLRHPAVRTRLPVALDDTIEEIEPGRFRWVRPGRWERDKARGDLRFVPDALANSRAGSGLFASARRLLEGGPLAYQDLVERLAANAGIDEEAAAAETGRLLDLGFLRSRLPWPGNQAHVELELLQFLRTLPLDTCSGEFAEIFCHLVQLVNMEQSYHNAPEPEQALQEMARLINLIGNVVGTSVNVRVDLEVGYRRGRFYEDVLLAPREDTGPPELVRVSRAAMERVLTAVEPMIRLAFLYNHRHDFLHALSYFAADRFPGQERVGLLDLFSATQPLWREYTQFMRSAAATSDGWLRTFDPFGLSKMAELDRLRNSVWQELGASVERSEDADVISAELLNGLLAPIPDCFGPLVGLSLFLQPLDESGDQWFLNRMHEGIGRYGSRFTSVMEERGRVDYTSHLRTRAPFLIDGEPIELLDIMCAQGDTLNVHAVQTQYVLDLHGHGLPPSPARRILLRDLRVELAGPRGLSWLVDGEGLRFLPVHLGGANHTFMPILLQFLCLFGPGEFRSVWPPRSPRRQGDAEVLERLRIGSVVFGRRQWSFPSIAMTGLLSLPYTQAFVAFQRWRVNNGLPERVFVQERIVHKVLTDRAKPQYLDFSSPLFLPVLRDAIQSSNGTVSFTEVLPLPDAYPRDRHGRRWAVEILLDSLALRSPRNTSRNESVESEPWTPNALESTEDGIILSTTDQRYSESAVNAIDSRVNHEPSRAHFERSTSWTR